MRERERDMLFKIVEHITNDLDCKKQAFKGEENKSFSKWAETNVNTNPLQSQHRLVIAGFEKLAEQLIQVITNNNKLHNNVYSRSWMSKNHCS